MHMKLKRLRVPLPNPRPIRFYQTPDPTFHNLQIALALLAEDERPDKVDQLIRNACHDAADADDFYRIQRICGITAGKKKRERIPA